VKTTIHILCALLAGVSYVRAAERADFAFAAGVDVAVLDPARMVWNQDIVIAHALWEGLYSLDPRTLRPIPGTADRISISDDRCTYTFHIRDSARWSNGDPVTSADFVFAWRRMLENPGEYTYLLHYIKGAGRYREDFVRDSATADWESVGVQAPDPATIIVTLRSPIPFFPDIAAFPIMFPQHAGSMEPFKQPGAKAGQVRYAPGFTEPGKLVTNGPFLLASVRSGASMTLAKNPHYWDANDVLSNTIESRYFKHGRDEFAAFERREIDWIPNPAGEVVAELRARARPELRSIRMFSTYSVVFNCRRNVGGSSDPNPLADTRVRQAMAMSVNRRTILEDYVRYGHEITTQFVPPTNQPYRRPQGQQYNVARARQLLSQARYPAGKDMPELSFVHVGNHETVEKFAEAWKTLGITIRSVSVSEENYRTRLNNGQFHIAIAGWNGDYLDASTFIDKYRSDSLNNNGAWHNADYDALVDHAARELDQPTRLEFLSKAEQILLDQAPIIPLYNQMDREVIHPSVKGLIRGPRGSTSFKKVTVSR
jgi:oligopeptide transport system substrate-binding protein